MTNAFLSEWLKLRRRAMLLGGIGATVFVAGVATIAQILSAGQPGPGGGEAPRTIASLSEADGLTTGLTGAATLIGAVTLAVWAIAVANEYSLGTLRNLLVRQPHRLRLLAGKLTALASFTAVAVTLGAAVSVALAFALAPGKDIDTSAWLTSDGLGALASAWLNTVLASVGFGLLGAALGTLVRAPAGAIGAGLAWVLVGESILSAAWEDVGRWLPGQLLQTVGAGGSSSTSYLSALVGATVVVGGLTAFGSYLFATREVGG